MQFQAKRTVETILRMARCKDKHKRDMRYDSDWLLECQLMRIKSPRLYVHLRERGLMPLPSLQTLRNLTAAMSPSFGFNTFGLQMIKKRLQDLPVEERFVCYSFDEMGIAPECEFNKSTLQFDGLMTNYKHLFNDEADKNNNDSSKDCSANIDKTLADHALVLMVRNLMGPKWELPIAVFPAKNAVKGSDLPKLFTKAMIALEDIGARVIACVCDGSQTNVTFWNQLGVFGRSNDLKGKRKKVFCNKVRHPSQDETPIWFLRDAPHLMKCIRNHILNHRNVQVIF